MIAITIVALKNFYKICIGSYSFQKNLKKISQKRCYLINFWGWKLERCLPNGEGQIKF